jgi:tRNA threonylcarbamoyladenosine biosynthesis protein TsaB
VLILALDTALSACSVALVEDGQTLVSRVEPMARGQAERLAPMVNEVMVEAGLSFKSLDRIAVTCGPGAFTGLRIGLAFARGLALALDKPCVGISTLEVLAAAASQPRIVATIDLAGNLFVGAWEGRRVVMGPCATQLDDVLGILDGPWAVTGPGAAVIVAKRPDWFHIDQNLPDPVTLAHLAAHCDPADYPPTPLYLRGVNAKMLGDRPIWDIRN